MQIHFSRQHVDGALLRVPYAAPGSAAPAAISRAEGAGEGRTPSPGGQDRDVLSAGPRGREQPGTTRSKFSEQEDFEQARRIRVRFLLDTFLCRRTKKSISPTGERKLSADKKRELSLSDWHTTNEKARAKAGLLNPL